LFKEKRRKKWHICLFEIATQGVSLWNFHVINKIIILKWSLLPVDGVVQMFLNSLSTMSKIRTVPQMQQKNHGE
jgi:hypothetical protein